MLSDLLGEPTPGGIDWSLREVPTTPSEAVEVFRRWTRLSSWRVGQYTFYEAQPDAEWADSPAGPPSATDAKMSEKLCFEGAEE